MFDTLGSLFAPPVFENDEEKTRTAYLLNIVILGLLVTSATTSVVLTLVVFRAFEVRSGIALCFCLLLIAIYSLMRRGYVQVAVILLILILWGVVTVSLVRLGGVRLPGFTTYLVITLLAGLLLGIRAGVVVAGLSVLTGIGLLYAETSGLILYTAANAPPGLALTTHSALLIITTLLLYLYTRQVNQALEQSHRNERALAESNRQLQNEITERRRAEEKLRQSQARLKLALDAGAIATWDWDILNDRVYGDERLARLFGVDTEQAADGLPLMDFVNAIHEEDRPQVAAQIEQAVQTGERYTAEYRVVGAGNGYRWVVAHGQVERDAEGKAVRFPGTVADITERKRIEQQLRDNEKLLRTVAENVPRSYLSVINSDLTIDFANGQEFKRRQLNPEMFIGLHMRDVFGAYGEEVLETVTTAYRRAFAGQEQFFELFIGGEHQFYETVPLVNEQGEIHQILAVVQNITERKQAEAALRSSEERLHLLMEHAPFGIQVFDMDGTLVQVNKTWEEIWGVRAEDVVGIFNALHDPQIEALGLRTFVERAFAGQVVHFQDVRYVPNQSHMPGRERWVRAYCYHISDKAGQIQNVVLLNEDVTERKRVEETLAQHEEYFRSLIENALDIISILDKDGLIRYESPAIERVLGYNPEELVGQNAFELVHPSDMPEVISAFTEATQIAGPAAPIEFRFRHKDGSWRILEAIGSNLLDDPVVAGIVVNSRDITDRRNLEEQFRQAQKMEALGQLTAGIAHDFNNLLTAINGFAGLMQFELPPDDPQQDSVARILKSGQRAAELVRQLLAFSRRQVIEPRVMNLNTVVAGMDTLLSRVIGEDIILETELASDLWSVKVDPTQIEQVIVNLAVNARDAMPDGGRLTIETANVLLDEVYVRQHWQTQPGEHVLLAISDTGLGMSEEVQAHIFEPFFTTKAQGKGTGLGLATVYGIVRQSGGHIWLYSEPKSGTTFKIYLPRVQEKTVALDQTGANAEMLSGDETILLVEDDAEVRDLVRRVLQTQGYTLLEAEDGERALQVAADYAGSIHLLLTDVIMPGMSGKTLADQLVQLRPGIKVLFMSGYTDNAIMHHGVLDPGITLLQKPFGPTVLARKVRYVLDY